MTSFLMQEQLIFMRTQIHVNFGNSKYEKAAAITSCIITLSQIQILLVFVKYAGREVEYTVFLLFFLVTVSNS